MYIQLNGQILYYEKEGEGSPIILMHGNGESHEVFDVLIPALSKNHTVYAVDTRGHGESATPKEYHYDDMAEDIVEFIEGLSIVRPAFYGFSDGGIVGLLVASKYPDKLSKLIISGANLTPNDLRFSCLHHMKKDYKKTQNPLTGLLLQEPSIPLDQLHFISIPTLVLAGAKDIVKKSATKKIAKHIPNATLCIVDGEDHGSYVVHSEKLYPLIRNFLD
jgi:pimeloyl-ACP methyl ester carboxylesterase